MFLLSDIVLTFNSGSIDFSLPDLESLHNCDLKQYRFVVRFFHPDSAAAYNHKSSCIFQSVVKTNGDIVF